MPRIDGSIEIKATPATVFQYISDLEALPEWVKWWKDVDVTSLSKKGVGTTDAAKMQVGPQKQATEGLVTEFKEGEFYTRRLSRGMKMTERLAVVKFGEGSKVAYIVEYEPPMGLMGKMVDMLFMERLFEQLMGDTMTNLKERFEGVQ
jgi:uncharacterized membrane protein